MILPSCGWLWRLPVTLLRGQPCWWYQEVPLQTWGSAGSWAPPCGYGCGCVSVRQRGIKIGDETHRMFDPDIPGLYDVSSLNCNSVPDIKKRCFLPLRSCFHHFTISLLFITTNHFIAHYIYIHAFGGHHPKRLRKTWYIVWALQLQKILIFMFLPLVPT